MDGHPAAVVRLGLQGAPGVGKTTAVERLVRALRARSVSVGGFVTRELREHDRRTGFTCADLDGGEAVIAHTSWSSGPRVGRYRVDVTAFESLALPALLRAADRSVTIVDELGGMELLSTSFVSLVQRLLEEPAPIVMTLHSKPHPITDALRRRPDVEIVEVTRANRDRLVEILLERLAIR